MRNRMESAKKKTACRSDASWFALGRYQGQHPVFRACRAPSLPSFPSYPQKSGISRFSTSPLESKETRSRWKGFCAHRNRKENIAVSSPPCHSKARKLRQHGFIEVEPSDLPQHSPVTG